MSDVVEVIVTGTAYSMPGLVETLLDERLSACGQLTSIEATYCWRGSIERATEIYALMHTTGACAEAVARRVRKLHTNDAPCILALPVLQGDLATLLGSSEKPNN